MAVVSTILPEYYQPEAAMSVSQVAHRLRTQIGHFSGELSVGLPKVAGRFIEEMLNGIQAGQSLRLTEAARNLEEKIALKKTHDRLCRQIGRPGLGEHIDSALLKKGAQRIGDDTLLILDVSDVCKKYARRMEYMAAIRDGSENVIGEGYWTLNVIGVESEGHEIVPLALKLYSQDAPGFVSENREILSTIEAVSEATQRRGIWVIDRGGDRQKLIRPLLAAGRRFIIRLVGNRNLTYRGRTVLAKELAHNCPMHYAETIIREDRGQERAVTIEFGYRKVKLPKAKRQLYLVVVKGLGDTPMMLLTTEPMRKKRATLWFVISSYLTRWKVEETIRYIKKSYQLEDIRLLRYRALRNMMSLLLATIYFTAVWLGKKIKLAVLTRHVLKAAKRLFGIPDFRYYALSDGIRAILARSPGSPARVKPPPSSPQLTLTLTYT
jgi:hypothetical protein